MRRKILLILFIVFTVLGGCSNTKPVKTLTQNYQRIDYSNPTNNIAAFTVASDSDLYVLEVNGFLKQYQNDGTFVKEFADTRDFTSICYDDNSIYAYDAVKHQIVSLNVMDGSLNIIIKDFAIDEVLKLVKVNNYLYALVVPEAHGNFEPGLNSYINYGEKLYQIDLKTGKLKDTKQNNIIAIYGSSDDMLYYYSYRDNEYALYSYNSNNGKSVKIYEMNEIGYISAFIYEGDNFVCSTLENTNIKYITFTNGMEDTIIDNKLIISGNDMVFYKGNIIYYGYSNDNKPNNLTSKYVGDINLIDEIDHKDVNHKDNKGTIVVSTTFRSYINPDIIKQKEGIKTKIVDSSVYDEVLLTEIMSGNPDIDIYITRYGSSIASGIQEKNIYVPLNNSKIINDYMDTGFDYVSDAMKSKSGDIWMIPISLDADVIWYVPENIEKSAIDLNDFTYLDSFMKLSEQMKENESYVAYVDLAANFGFHCHNQYDVTYNNYLNKSINFETPLYKHIFDLLWSGWINFSQNPRHPAFQNSFDDYNGELLSESSLFDKSKLIYKLCGIGDHINLHDVSLEGWRALPLPRISSDVNGNIVNMTCAFINPYSKNKDLAIEYLEAITTVPFDFNSENTGIFMFKDKSLYQEHYDVSQTAFNDLLHIMQNGRLINKGFNLNDTIIDDYQNGRLSLDEAIKKVQREVEMWLNE